MESKFFENQTIIDKMSSIEKNKIKIKKEKVIIKKVKGQKLSNIYILVSGVALLEAQDEEAKKFMYLITENKFFGIENLILNDSSRIRDLEYTVTALTDCSYLEIDAELFLDHVYIDPFSYHSIFSDLVSRYFLLAQSYQYINQPPEIKLGISLMNIASILKIKKNDNGEIIFPKYITQSFLSQYVRSSEPNLSKASVYLEKKRILKRKPFVIIDEPKLKEMIKKKAK